MLRGVSMTTKVSVIIPVYNVEKYLHECMNSVVHQTLRDIEIICVDDKSTDGSLDILREFEAKDARIQVICLDKNSGQSVARNVGLEKAKGEYVQFVDSDDWITENTLEALYHESKCKDLDIIYFDANTVYEDEKLKRSQKRFKDYYRREFDYTTPKPGKRLFVDFIKNNHYRVSPCMQMLRLSFLKKHDIAFYKGILHEDELFTFSTLLLAERTAHVSQPFYQRRVRDESTMTGRKEFDKSYGYFISLRECLSSKTVAELTGSDEIEAVKTWATRLQRSALRQVEKMPLVELDKNIRNLSCIDQMGYLLFVRNVRLGPPSFIFSRSFWQRVHGNLSRKFLKAKIKLSILKENTTGYRTRRRYKASFEESWKTNKKEIPPDLIAVSIIVPIYNSAKYLDQCVDMLETQTLKQIEVIFVDNGSTDDSLEILERRKSGNLNMSILQEKIQGAGNARNVGFDHSVGEYVLFLDSDDIFDKKLCERAYAYAKFTDAEIVLFKANRINVQTNVMEPMNWVLSRKYIPKGKAVFSAKDAEDDIFRLTVSCPWSKLFRREFIVEHNLRFQNLINTNDVLFVRLALASANKISTLQETLVTYRFNETTSTQGIKHLHPTEFYKAFAELRKELIARGLFDTVQQGFSEMVQRESMHHLSTVSTEEAKSQIQKLLLSEEYGELISENNASGVIYD